MSAVLWWFASLLTDSKKKPKWWTDTDAPGSLIASLVFQEPQDAASGNWSRIYEQASRRLWTMEQNQRWPHSENCLCPPKNHQIQNLAGFDVFRSNDPGDWSELWQNFQRRDSWLQGEKMLKFWHLQIQEGIWATLGRCFCRSLLTKRPVFDPGPVWQAHWWRSQLFWKARWSFLDFQHRCSMLVAIGSI